MQFGADDVPEKWQKLCLEAFSRRREIKKLEEFVELFREVFGGADLLINPHANLLKTIGELERLLKKLDFFKSFFVFFGISRF